MKAKKSGGVPVWVWAAGGGGVLVAGIVAVLVFGGKGGLLGKSPPQGWTDVRDTEANFRVFLPGQVWKSEIKGNAPPGMVAWSGIDGTSPVRVQSILPPDNSTFGNQPDQLYAQLKSHGIDGPWHDVVSKTPVTLGGKPGLEVRIQYKKGWLEENVKAPERPKGSERPKREQLKREPPPGLPPDALKRWEENEKKRQKDDEESDKRMEELGKKFDEEWDETQRQMKESRKKSDESRTEKDVYFVATNGKRLVVIHLHVKSEFPSDETLKTIRESFEFL